MARESLAQRKFQTRSFRVAPKVAQLGPADTSPEFERKWFEIDRGVVIGMVNTLLAAIIYGTNELEMVAAEKMFDEPLNRALSESGQALHEVTRQLKKLHGAIMKATGYPKVDKG